MPTEAEDMIKEAVLSGKNILVGGQCGSGKSTLLKQMMTYYPSETGLAYIKDKNLDYIEQNFGCVKSENVTDFSTSLQQALKHRVETAVISELYGAEAYLAWQHMQCGTQLLMSIHAVDCSSALMRFILCAYEENRGTSEPTDKGAIARSVHDVVDYIIHIERDDVSESDERFFIKEIVKVSEDGLTPVFQSEG